MKLILILGLPGAGKTTLAKNMLLSYPNLIRVNKDDFRSGLLGDSQWTKEKEIIVQSAHKAAIMMAVERGFNVVCDDAGLLYPKTRLNIVNWAKSIDPTIEVEINDALLEVPIETCIERDALRDRPVGADVILKFQESLKFLLNQIKLGRPMY